MALQTLVGGMSHHRWAFALVAGVVAAGVALAVYALARRVVRWHRHRSVRRDLRAAHSVTRGTAPPKALPRLTRVDRDALTHERRGDPAVDAFHRYTQRVP